MANNYCLIFKVVRGKVFYSKCHATNGDIIIVLNDFASLSYYILFEFF